MLEYFREDIARAAQSIDIAIALCSRLCSDAHELQTTLPLIRQEIEQVNQSFVKAGHRDVLSHVVKSMEAKNARILQFQLENLSTASTGCHDAIHAVQEAHHAIDQLIQSLRRRLSN